MVGIELVEPLGGALLGLLHILLLLFCDVSARAGFFRSITLRPGYGREKHNDKTQDDSGAHSRSPAPPNQPSVADCNLPCNVRALQSGPDAAASLSSEPSTGRGFR